MYIVSACLVGVNCKYNGGNNDCEWVREFIKDKKYVLVCPEALGNLSTPRPPSEFINGRAIDKNGKDITDNLILGAAQSFKKVEKKAEELGEEIEFAILKANSPSCGSGKLYDGTFSGKLIDGDGIFAALLREKGIRVISEKDKEKMNHLNRCEQEENQ